MDLSQYQWKNRVVLIKGDLEGPEVTDALDQLRALQEELNERDTLIFQQAATQFSIHLIGKDGTQKWASKGNFSAQQIIEIIDSMPMRKHEAKTTGVQYG